MINPNYRYAHLARLIQIINGPLPGMQAVRRLDQNFETTYFNDIFHGRYWPAYVTMFALEDALSDMATDYAAEIYDADNFGDWLSSQKKIKMTESPNFTPTADPKLRTELALDQFENSWLFGVNRTNFRRELSKNELSYKPQYAFTGYATRMHLTYALFAKRRTGAEKLYAYCLAQAIFSELFLKLFQLPRAAQFHPLPSDELLTIGEPIETVIDILQPSIAWSYDTNSLIWFSDQTAKILSQLLAFADLVQMGTWPDQAQTENAFNILIGNQYQETLVTLCAPQLFNTIIQA